MSKIPNIDIEWLGGNCPVQAVGTVEGLDFYFRARGSNWSIEIGKLPWMKTLVTSETNLSENQDNVYFDYVESYGKWPDAGWIDENEALFLIRRGCQLFYDSQDQ